MLRHIRRNSDLLYRVNCSCNSQNATPAILRVALDSTPSHRTRKSQPPLPMFISKVTPSEQDFHDETPNIMTSLFENVPNPSEQEEESKFLLGLWSPGTSTLTDEETLTRDNLTPASAIDETSSGSEFEEISRSVSVMSLREDSQPNAVSPTADTPKHRSRTQPDRPGEFVINSFRIKLYGTQRSKHSYF
jgi:hypothetical protein